ncbi:MAG TPA: monovalent cation/H(+) antiporter subunit G [Xanthobacteraceae bacterium]|nr:monovalent cation/H(+) antiporter subunit G [Xanthobacteraceae bacterium]
MSSGEIPFWAEILASVLLVSGAAITLIGTCGLLRLKTFYDRVHAPTLGTTLGTVFVVAASMIYFLALGNRFVLHELLIVIFVTVTTPITLLVLVRAAQFRDEFEGERALKEAAKNNHSGREESHERP